MVGSKRKIVVVDDDECMILAMRRLLGAAGFEVAPFHSAEALLQEGAARSAACLVLDIRLPDCCGLELYRRLADSGVHAPVVFITAYEEPEWQTQAENVGASGYLTKPFEGRNLLSAIEKALEPA